MNYEQLKGAIRDKVKEAIVKDSYNFNNEFKFHYSDDPTELIGVFDLRYNEAVAPVVRAVLDGVRDGINQASDMAFGKCISKAVKNGDISEERADIVSNEYNSYESMNLKEIVDNYFNNDSQKDE